MLKRKVLVLVSVLLIFSLLLVACGKKDAEPQQSGEQQELGNEAVATDYLVNVQWLKDNSEQENLLILDARGEDAYKEGHIPGSIPVRWQQFAKMDGAPGQENWGVLLDAPSLSEQFSNLGIDKDKSIVIYADPNGWGEDGRILWMLRMAGVEKSRILNGGWPAWVAADGDVRKSGSEPTRSQFEITELKFDTFASTEWLRDNLDAVTIIDTRNPKEFQGATDFGEARGGHIPGAINIPFKEFFNNDGTIKTTSEIRALMNEQNIPDGATIVTYCTAGIRSAHMTMVLKMAGYTDVRNYDASIYEWAGNEALPMEQ